MTFQTMSEERRSQLRTLRVHYLSNRALSERGIPYMNPRGIVRLYNENDAALYRAAAQGGGTSNTHRHAHSQ